MGYHLQLGVVAEGIENEQQLMSLREHQCHVGQGYFFSKPLPPVQAERLFNRSFMKRQEGA
jgi:EAL domain-containing protein (putative c-di-GMP-specific phosphodiesterase class I)